MLLEMNGDAAAGFPESSHQLVAFRDRRPQTVSMETEAIEFGLLARAARDHGAALVVYLEHQLRCLRVGIVEELLENPRHVRHEVDGIVPNDDEPGAIGFDLLLGRRV